MEKIKYMNKRNVLVMLVMVSMMFVFDGCGHDKEEAIIREVAQKYFDALKIGDWEGVYDCYLPVERQKRDAESGLLSFASKLILKMDISDVLSGLSLLSEDENAFAKYKYKAADVKVDEDGMNAVAYVEVYEVYDDKALQGNLSVNMTKYDGDWYVIKGTIAEVDHTSEEAVSDSDKANLLTRLWRPILIAVALVTGIVLILLFFRMRGGKKRIMAEMPYADLSAGKMEQGDILCSCGTVNPAGIRTCMGCGKKIKRRR